MKIKLLALNFCEEENNVNIGLMLKHFLEGAKDSGADIELISANNLKIGSCQGCTVDYNFVSNGNCDQMDDMQMIYPKLKQSDIWVIIVPFNPDKLSESFTNFLDRLEPLFNPFTTIKNGTPKKNTHLFKGKVVLMSSTNFWDINVFVNLIEQINDVCLLYNREFTNAILRPHSWVLSVLEQLGLNPESYFMTLNQAGIELIKNGFISDVIVNSISRELVAKKSFTSQLNEISAKSLLEFSK